MTIRLLSLISLLLSLLIIISSCRKDELLEEKEDNTPITNIETLYETQISGRVLDEFGLPIARAEIRVSDRLGFSDDFGFYSIDNVNAPSSGLYISISAQGYHEGGELFIPIQVGDVFHQTQLANLIEVSFDAREGINYTTPQGSMLDIPADAIAANGQAFEGEVILSIRQFNPRDITEEQLIPGSFKGLQVEDIVSFDGWVAFAISLSSTSNQQLNLREGSEARISYATNEASSSAVELWHLDNNDGTWINEGEAILDGSVYIGDLSSFSWWACGPVTGISVLCLDIITDNNNANYDLYCLKTGNERIISCTFVESGTSCHLIPSNESITIEVFDACLEPYYSENLGFFDTGFDQSEEIIVTIPTPANQTITLSGQLIDCNDQPISENVIISARHGGQEYIDNTVDETGYQISFTKCAGENDITLSAYDLNDLTSTTQSISIADEQDLMLDLKACDDPIETFLLLDDGTRQVILTDCIAISSRSETLIRALRASDDNSDGTLLGFRGFQSGSFNGNLISFSQIQDSGAQNGLIDQATIEVSEYGAVGAYISGSFSDGNITGSFVAKRTR